MRISSAFLLSAILQTAAFAEPSVDLAAARSSLTGNWEGSLEYLDYGANKWFGIPVTTRIEDQGDGATVIRKSDFDDGPTVGTVRITSVELFDAVAATVTTASFRKGKAVSVDIYSARIDGVAKDRTHWTMIEEVKATDDDRPAMLRLITTRDGDSLQTLKQVDFLDDAKPEWISRNRTTLKRIGS